MYTRILLRLLAVSAIVALPGGNLSATAAPATPTPAASPARTVAQQPVPVCGGSLPAGADTYVNSLAPDTVYGSATALAIGLPRGTTEYALFRFDIAAVLAPDTTVQHAELQLTLPAPPNQQPFPLEVHEITGTWSETSTNWNNRPPLGADYGAAGYNVDGNLLRIDVTELAVRWFSTEVSPTVSLAVLPVAAGSLMQAVSREGSATSPALAPHLVITCSVHVGNPWPNAQYTGGICDIFEFGDGFPQLDVVGHERTHGVDGSEGDLNYENQSGALDESFADIFGYFVAPINWTVAGGVPGGPLAT